MPGGGAPPVVTSKKTPADPKAYIIGEQDVLTITVWKEKELSGGVVVRPDGKITVPLVGEIMVVGMTPVQLQDLLAEKLKPFVTVPQVTVAVNEIRSRKVYLIGHAGREGPFPINSTTTVLQIIAQAGGLKDFAKRKKIYILRQNGKEQQRFLFNYDDVLKGKHREQDILLAPGDTIVVP
jgi:polysaccharide export outer membrane protein